MELTDEQLQRLSDLFKDLDMTTSTKGYLTARPELLIFDFMTAFLLREPTLLEVQSVLGRRVKALQDFLGRGWGLNLGKVNSTRK